MLQSNLDRKQANIALRALAAHLGDLGEDASEPYRDELLTAVNEATAALPPSNRLAGVHFAADTPLIVLLRALGTLAVLVPEAAESPEPAQSVRAADAVSPSNLVLAS